MNLLHDCMFSHLKNQQLCRASYVTTSYIAHLPSLLVVKRVASTFVEVSLCFGFCVFGLMPIPLTVLCVSTCSDGLLDFHTQPKKHATELSETLRFQKIEILGTLSASLRLHSNSFKQEMSQVVVLHHPSC